MKTRNVELVASPRPAHFVGDGFRVHNFIPYGYRLEMERMNPFILLDYNSKFFVKPSDRPKGVGVHPHKGFETVTIAYKGKVEHHDSHGGGGVIGEGDVQWMTAGNGVLHKEFHEKEWSKKGGIFQMVQLWVNLSAKNKKQNPKYQSIVNQAIPRYYLDNDKGKVEVIAGEYKSVKGTALTFSPIHMYNVKVKKGAELDFSFPVHYNTALLVIEGSITVNGQEHAPTNHLVLMLNDGEDFKVKADEDTIVLAISGEPIQEPIVAYGPFVMNTREEIGQAYQDFTLGKYGVLAD
ncbi:MAG: pirin family protein [Chitinophagales bacterium]|nr:pirin family protein [Chitinophagales bacterium]